MLTTPPLSGSFTVKTSPWRARQRSMKGRGRNIQSRVWTSIGIPGPGGRVAAGGAAASAWLMVSPSSRNDAPIAPNGAPEGPPATRARSRA